MKLNVLGSGSSGNCYTLTDDQGNILIIECGIHQMEIKKGIAFNIGNVSGCLVTHGHMDHCKSISDILGLGVDVYASQGTLEETGTLEHHRSNVMAPMKKYKIGPYTVLGFKTIHDTKEPFGFIINHTESGNICFLTDSVYSPFRFANITHWLVEANYSEEIMDDKIKNGGNKFLRDRVISSHFSFQNTMDMLNVNDLTKTRTITLTHLSDTNSHAEQFKSRTMELYGKNTYIAEKGLEVDYNKTPF